MPMCDAPRHASLRGARPSVMHRRLRNVTGGLVAATRRLQPVAAEPERAASSPGTPASSDPWSMLGDFTRKEFRRAAGAYLQDASSRRALRDALLVLLGVVASDARLAVRALRDWCEALDLAFVRPECRVTGAASLGDVQGPVYIKYNSKTQACYLSRYQGVDRGVLIQLGQIQLGHFPLGLFDEEKAKPPPAL